MAGWLPTQSRRKELLIINIIHRVKKIIKSKKTILSRIPANSGHSLLPVFAENKRYYNNVFPTILLKHTFKSGANCISENPKLAHITVRKTACGNWLLKPVPN